jgi:hypothetical protein
MAKPPVREGAEGRPRGVAVSWFPARVRASPRPRLAVFGAIALLAGTTGIIAGVTLLRTDPSLAAWT